MPTIFLKLFLRDFWGFDERQCQGLEREGLEVEMVMVNKGEGGMARERRRQGQEVEGLEVEMVMMNKGEEVMARNRGFCGRTVEGATEGGISRMGN